MKTKDKIARFFVYGASIITFLSLLFIIFYILIKGIPYLKPSLFEWEYTVENVSMMPSIINTLIIVGLSLVIAIPIGISAAVYLTEYAKPGSKLVELVRITADTLTGIPSIVYGLFGMLFFVTFLGWSYSMMAGAMTAAIMVLPLIMRSTEEALMSVPQSLREGSYGLGAGKVRTIFRIILPSAMPGILSGVILAVGRIIGETAALIYTSGTVANIPENLLGANASGRTLALHMYVLSGEGLNINEAYASGVVLLGVILIINFISKKLADKLGKEGVNE